MDAKNFEILQNALAYLEWNSEKAALEKLREIYDQKLYFVAFIGQYSAGKSRLINNLLKNNILPEGISETTPLLTYIRYGERAYARLHYQDGGVQVLEPGQVAGIAQQNKDSWNMDELAYLEVFVQEPAFQNGMVLLDTPGVNTLIRKHEMLLASSLAMASKIIYVTNGTPTRVDMDQLEQLALRGLDVSFVRTRCDMIHENEEDPADVIRADQEMLAGVGVAPEDCYHISNLPDSKWFAAIYPLRGMLAQKGAQAAQELEQAAGTQLAALARRCCAALEERQELLRAANDKDTVKLEEKRRELERQIQDLQDKAAARKSSLEEKIRSCQREIEGKMLDEIEDQLEQSAKEIKNSDVGNEDQMRDLLCRKASRLAQKAERILNVGVDPIVAEINGELAIPMLSVEQGGMPLAENYAQLCDEQDGELEQLRTQLQVMRQNSSALETKLETILAKTDQDQLYQELQVLEEQLTGLQDQYRQLPPYVPKLIEADDGGFKPSQIGKTIGNIADWALLLLPGANIGAAATKLAGSSKLIAQLAKLLGGTEKVAHILASGDTVKDILFALKNLSKTYATQRRMERAKDMVIKTAEGLQAVKENAPAGLLDMLSIGYWTERIGMQFDKPPRMIVDQEYEKNYREQKQKIEEEMLAHQKEVFRKKKDLGLYQTEKERIEAERKSLIIDQEKVESELRKREAEIRRDAGRRALAAWKEQCAEWYRDQLSAQIRTVVKQYAQELPERLDSYQDRRLETLITRLNEHRAAYNAIAGADQTETAIQLRTVTDLLEQVRMCV